MIVSCLVVFWYFLVIIHEDLGCNFSVVVEMFHECADYTSWVSNESVLCVKVRNNMNAMHCVTSDDWTIVHHQKSCAYVRCRRQMSILHPGTTKFDMNCAFLGNGYHTTYTANSAATRG